MLRRGGNGRSGKQPPVRRAGSRPARRRQPSLTELHGLLDSLDAALLSGDLQRADKLTVQLFDQRDQAASALAQRLIDGRAPVPLLAFELLPLLAGQRADSLLRRIAQNPRTLDIVRWGAHRRLGWPEEGEAPARLSFLASLGDADGTLVEAVAQAGAFWPPNAEILQEALSYLKLLPPEHRLALVQRAVGEGCPEIAWLLRALIHLEDPPLQHLAISELVRLHDRAAIGSLSRLAQTTPDSQLRAEAEAASRRLRLALVGAKGNRALSEPQAWPRVDRVLMTEIDGDGGQAFMLTRCSDAGAAVAVNVLTKDRWGVKEAFGYSHVPAEGLFEHILDLFGEQDLETVEVDIAAARGSVALALQANIATGHPLPPEFELWEPFLHESFPPQDDEPVVAPELDDALYLRRTDLRGRSAKLLQHPLFRSWFFDPEEFASLFGSVPLPTRGSLTDRQYRPLIETLVDSTILQCLGQRLRRQAWLLDQLGDQADRDQALAAAASLRTRERDLAQNPFLRGMIDVSLENLAGGLFDVAIHASAHEPFGSRQASLF